MRHVSYEEELWFKRNKALQALKRIGGVELEVSDIISANNIDNYRNKAIIPINRNKNGIQMGYYRAGTHDIIPCMDCRINAPEINLCARITKDFLEKNNISAARHLFVRAVSGGAQAGLIVNGGLNNREKWIEKLRDNCPDIKSILLIENKREDNVLLCGEIECLWGDLTVNERMGDLDFELHPFAFAQVNTAQAVKLYDLARDYAGEYNTAADLFCGTGTLTLWLARNGNKTFGIEIVAIFVGADGNTPLLPRNT
jgi:23S rRNA (uracil1939-C5)-methyltransferase